MSIAAETAIRDWINGLSIVEPDAVIPRGAYLIEQRSPAYGAYIVLARTGTPQSPVAEQSRIDMAHIDCTVYAGSQDVAEKAAAALRGQFELCTGVPQRCGLTGVYIMVADNFSGPINIPIPADSGELYAFLVGADFMLTE